MPQPALGHTQRRGHITPRHRRPTTATQRHRHRRPRIIRRKLETQPVSVQRVQHVRSVIGEALQLQPIRVVLVDVELVELIGRLGGGLSVAFGGVGCDDRWTAIRDSPVCSAIARMAQPKA